MPPERPARRPALGTAAVLLSVSVWGATAIVVRKIDGIDGLVVGWHRLWIGTIATLAAFYATGRRLTMTHLRTAIPGGLAFGADLVLFFSALNHTTVANATVVGALQPALVLLVAGRLFGEPVTGSLIAWSVAAIAGVAVVVYGSSGEAIWSPLGDVLAVGSLLAWTAYFIFSRQVRDALSPFEYLTSMLVVATVAITPIALLKGGPLLPAAADDWVAIALLAVGAGGVGHLLINWAHHHIDLSVMSLLTLAIPVVAVISAALFLDEEVTAVQAAGMAVVLLALGVVAVRSARPVPAPPTPEPVAASS